MKKQNHFHHTLEELRRQIDDPAYFALAINQLLETSLENMKAMASVSMCLPEEVSVIKKYKGHMTISLPQSSLPETPIGPIFMNRSSHREYKDEPLTIEEVSAVLRYGYGIRGYMPAYSLASFPFRTAPSAGGLQGIEVYCLINNVDGVSPGLYHYNPQEDCLDMVFTGICVGKLEEICRAQHFIPNAGIVIVLTIVLTRGTWKYCAPYYRFALVDCGCVAENLHLAASALGIGSCMVAGFEARTLKRLLQIEDDLEIPALMISFGKKK